MAKHNLYDVHGNPVISDFLAYDSDVAPTAAENTAAGYPDRSTWTRVTSGGAVTQYVKTAETTAGVATWTVVPAGSTAVLDADYAAQHDVLVAVNAIGTPIPVTLTVNTVLGRVAGLVKALTKAEQRQNILTASEAETNLLVGVNTLNETRLRTKTPTALVDGDAAPLTGAQTVGGILTIAASAPRTLTMDSTAALVAALAGSGVGTEFEFLLVNTGANSASLAMHANGTFVGHNSQLTVATHTSGTFLVKITGAATYSVYRK